MAAQAWKWYARAKRRLGAAQINLPSATFRMLLVTSASNFATTALDLLSSLTGEIADGNGYSTSGKALASQTWTAGASADQIAFDCADLVWTATGGAISNIKGAVLAHIGASAGARFVVVRASLTSSQFTLSSGNTLTVQIASAGMFTLANG